LPGTEYTQHREAEAERDRCLHHDLRSGNDEAYQYRGNQQRAEIERRVLVPVDPRELPPIAGALR
jgi:hypothetical protein